MVFILYFKLLLETKYQGCTEHVGSCLPGNWPVIHISSYLSFPTLRTKCVLRGDDGSSAGKARLCAVLVRSVFVPLPGVPCQKAWPSPSAFYHFISTGTARLFRHSVFPVGLETHVRVCVLADGSALGGRAACRAVRLMGPREGRHRRVGGSHTQESRGFSRTLLTPSHVLVVFSPVLF